MFDIALFLDIFDVIASLSLVAIAVIVSVIISRRM